MNTEEALCCYIEDLRRTNRDLENMMRDSVVGLRDGVKAEQQVETLTADRDAARAEVKDLRGNVAFYSDLIRSLFRIIPSEFAPGELNAHAAVQSLSDAYAASKAECERLKARLTDSLGRFESDINEIAAAVGVSDPDDWTVETILAQIARRDTKAECERLKAELDKLGRANCDLMLTLGDLQAKLAGRDTKAEKLPDGVPDSVWVNYYKTSAQQLGQAWISRDKALEHAGPFAGHPGQRYIHEASFLAAVATARAEGAAGEREEIAEHLDDAGYKGTADWVRARGKP